MGTKHGVGTTEKAQEKLQKVFVLMELSSRLDLMARNHFGFLPTKNRVWRGKEARHGNFVGALATVLCQKFQLGTFEELFRAHLKIVGL
ncbi:MAG: hypothetical protein K8Q97_03640 [Candidatus Andersenbacteria bacterium]|nr:hypothetical protein [Candidatus Andersenbacteria bacterium]